LSAAPKKKDEEFSIEAVELPSELPNDREQKLSKDFEDPALEELMPGLGNLPEPPAPLSVVEEAVEAVQELVQDAKAEPAAIDLTQELSENSFSIGALPESEPLESLPLPEPEGETSAPKPLPQTVNPDPDPLERSLLLSVPVDNVEDPVSMVRFDSKSEAKRLSALQEMSERLFELVVCEKSFDDLVDAALRAIMAGFGAQAGSVLELDHEREDFFFRASHGGSGADTKLKAFRVPLTKGIVGHVAESGRPLLLRDLKEDKMQLRAVSLTVGFEPTTCMAAPIEVGGQAYGVIELFNKTDGSLFDEKDLGGLEDAVRMFAKVLEVRFLLAELSRRLR
jgi:hypothetical protein